MLHNLITDRSIIGFFVTAFVAGILYIILGGFTGARSRRAFEASSKAMLSFRDPPARDSWLYVLGTATAICVFVSGCAAAAGIVAGLVRLVLFVTHNAELA